VPHDRRGLILAVMLLAGVVLAPAALAGCNDPAGPKVDWRRCFLDGADLAGHKLSGASLRDVAFTRANLAGADLRKADASRAKFLSANLAKARLDGARLTEADFTRADLTAATLAGADLSRARFFRAILREADLSGATVRGTDFTNADLSGATWTDGKRVCAEGSIGQCN
jgi:uncharacterized protein YjbI with pentapeptide repeats